MTDDERRMANAALTKFIEPNPLRLGTENRAELFIRGFAAGRESMQSTAKIQREMFGPAGVKHMGDVLLECKAEREWSPKLIEMLDVMVSECRSHIKMLAEKKVYVGVSWLNKAEALIAEYEQASRDR